MRIIARTISPAWKSARSWELLGAIALLWIVSLAVVPSTSGAENLGLRLPPCPLRYWTGILCPFCGITTGCAWMARGSLHQAWSSNILSPFLMTGSLLSLAYAAVFRFGLGRSLHLEPGAVSRRFSMIILLVAVSLSWIVNLLKR